MARYRSRAKLPMPNPKWRAHPSRRRAPRCLLTERATHPRHGTRHEEIKRPGQLKARRGGPSTHARLGSAGLFSQTFRCLLTTNEKLEKSRGGEPNDVRTTYSRAQVVRSLRLGESSQGHHKRLNNLMIVCLTACSHGTDALLLIWGG